MKKLFKVLTVITGLTLVGLLATTSLKAQSEAPLVVAPARQSLATDPGKTVGFAVRFYNTSNDPISGSFKAADFIVKDNQGTPTFLDGPTTLSDRYAAAKWVTLNTERGTIAGSGMVIINGTIKVPQNANPGGKYFAVFFEPDTTVPGATGGTQQEAASVTMRLAGLIYLRVNGPIAESAQVIRFSAPGFSEYGPVAITTEIKNGGDYHITPVGQITVKNMFGKEIAFSALQEANVFPDASRVSTTQVGKKWMVGRFTAALDAKYGDSDSPLNATLAFWVFPWKLAILVILGIIIIALILIIISNKFTKKEKKLEQELQAEKSELEELKEKLKDQVAGITPPSDDASKEENKPE